MSYMNNYRTYPSKAEGAVTAYYFGMVGTADNTSKLATAGAKIVGIFAETTDDTRAVPVAFDGVYMLKLGGTVLIGERIKATTGGVGIKADTDKDEYGAVALAGGVIGDIIPVLIEKGQLSI